jgi:hypothetical protein
MDAPSITQLVSLTNVAPAASRDISSSADADLTLNALS